MLRAKYPRPLFLQLLLLAFITIFSAPSFATQAAPPPRPVIVDTDMGGDDWLALLYLLKEPNVDVRAITISGTGETNCYHGMLNLLKILNVAHRTDIPTACGKEKPLLGQQVFPQFIRQLANNFNGLSYPLPTDGHLQKSATRLITDTIYKANTPVDIITLGPLTNIATAMIYHPQISKNIGTIYISGGAVGQPGNLNIPGYYKTTNTTAEWNMFIDPTADAIVFNAPVHRVIIPTNISSAFPITVKRFKHYQKTAKTPEAKLAVAILNTTDVMGGSASFRLWDLAAAIIGLNLSETSQIKHTKLRVETTLGTNTLGTLAIDKNGAPSDVVVAVNKEAVYDLFWQSVDK